MRRSSLLSPVSWRFWLVRKAMDRRQPSRTQFWRRTGCTLLCSARNAELVHALNRWRGVEAGAQPFVAQAILDAVDDLARREVSRVGSVRLPMLPMQSTERGVGLPDLGRIADPSGEGQGLLQRAGGVVPLAPGHCDLAPQPPAFDQVLGSVGARGDLQTPVGPLPGVGMIATGKTHIAHGREKVRRVPPAHPVAGGGILHDPVNLVDDLTGLADLPLGQRSEE